ncbi:MAG: hypothetical protein HZC14_02210 [Candidatus Niyogibacteria bacterium]|nr:hypothetical protein [Candidatus Niyogibacteria bacterium]
MNRRWFGIHFKTSDEVERDTDWEHEINELRREMEDALASSREVEQAVRHYVLQQGHGRKMAAESCLSLSVRPMEILHPLDDIYDGIVYAFIKAWNASYKVSVAVEELREEGAISHFTYWVMEFMPQLFLDYKDDLQETCERVPLLDSALLDQVDGKPLKKYSLSQLAFWNHIADHDVGESDAAWLKKLHLKPLDETVPEQKRRIIFLAEEEDTNWLKSFGMKPYSETFRRDQVAA